MDKEYQHRRFVEVRDDRSVVCPYCRHSYEPDFIDESGQVVDCDECGRNFWWQSLLRVTHQSTPDCRINGEEHEWVMRNGFRFCIKCDQPYRGVTG